MSDAKDAARELAPSARSCMERRQETNPFAIIFNNTITRMYQEYQGIENKETQYLL